MQMEAMRFCMNRPAEEFRDEAEQRNSGMRRNSRINVFRTARERVMMKRVMQAWIVLWLIV